MIQHRQDRALSSGCSVSSGALVRTNPGRTTATIPIWWPALSPAADAINLSRISYVGRDTRKFLAFS